MHELETSTAYSNWVSTGFMCQGGIYVQDLSCAHVGHVDSQTPKIKIDHKSE